MITLLYEEKKSVETNKPREVGGRERGTKGEQREGERDRDRDKETQKLKQTWLEEAFLGSVQLSPSLLRHPRESL